MTKIITSFNLEQATVEALNDNVQSGSKSDYVNYILSRNLKKK